MIYEKNCLAGIDPTQELVPIVPAVIIPAGGVMVDDHGRAGRRGFVCHWRGELYRLTMGANRMASNSLLECLVYGWSAAEEDITRS